MTTALLLSIRDQLADIAIDLQAKLPPTVISDPQQIKREIYRLRDGGDFIRLTFGEDADFNRWDQMPAKIEHWPELKPLARHLKRLDSYIAASQKATT